MKRLKKLLLLWKLEDELNETLKLFEEGSKLLKKCQQELADAEGKVEKLRWRMLSE